MKPFCADIVDGEPMFEGTADMPVGGFPGFTKLLGAMLFTKPFGADIAGVEPMFEETADMPVGGIPGLATLFPAALLENPLGAVKAGTELIVGGVTMLRRQM